MLTIFSIIAILTHVTRIGRKFGVEQPMGRVAVLRIWTKIRCQFGWAKKIKSKEKYTVAKKLIFIQGIA